MRQAAIKFSPLKGRQINGGVWWMGAVDWNRRLFDALVPLPDGTSYNAYLVRGREKTALIDAADPAKSELLLGQLEGRLPRQFPRGTGRESASL